MSDRTERRVSGTSDPLSPGERVGARGTGLAIGDEHDPDRRRSPAPFVWPVRVYWEDTDAGGVVYYANYLKFLERARSEWLRTLGVAQSDLAREHGVVFVVRRVEADYLRPAHFDDLLEVACSLEALGRASLTMAQEVRRGALTLLAARVKVACVERSAFRPVKIPGPVLERLAG